VNEPPLSPAARRRAVKRHVWAAVQRFVATCALGAEDLLAAELETIHGVAGVAPGSGHVRFEGPIDAALAVLVGARIPDSLRVLLLEDAAAGDYPTLHAQLRRVRWPLWLPSPATLEVRVRSNKSRVRDDAGIERSVRQAWRAAGIDDGAAGGPPCTVSVHLHRDRASVALHLGEALHRRSRATGAKWVTPTTIRETTAAALVRLARTAEHDLIVDPFCGSGTLITEALAASLGTPAHTDGLAFEHSPAWPPGRFAHALRTWRTARPTAPPPALEAFDADPEAVAATRHNLAGEERTSVVVTLGRAQDLDLRALAGRHGATRPLLLTNPPYGRGSAAEDAAPDALVRDLLARAHGWSYAFLYPRPEAWAHVAGVRVDHVRPVVTGGLRNTMVLGRVDPQP
jgi:putative N6-adenine-specific DNA methylase